ncbi:MAG: iron ABC transporter permease [Candidatus Bipolaricaulota bacterium]|nr:iron ABC transporter permease [Candidatus Bipolaricaulota bacterium]MDW8111512.1 iron ABC transporter permease [Candidatus Bipolaricaulota bacterium]
MALNHIRAPRVRLRWGELLSPRRALLALSALAIAAAIALPLLLTLWRGITAEFSLWATLWQVRLLPLLGNSLALAGAVTLGSLVLGVLLAWLIERTDLPGRRIFGPLLVATLVIPCYLIAIWHISFWGPRGLLERSLETLLGASVSVPTIYGFLGAWLILMIATYPYVYTLARAALRSLDPQMEEAARSLGARKLKIFFKVTLPLLAPALAAGGLLSAVYVLADYGVVAALRYETFTVAIYKQLAGRYDQAPAAVLSTVLIALTVVLLVLQQRLWGRGRHYYRASQKPLPVVRLSFWSRWAALGLVGLVLFLGLILPVGVSLYWWLEGMVRPNPTAVLWGTSLGDLWRYAGNSLFSAATAATLALVLAWPIAYRAVRYDQHSLTRLAQAGQALPGVLIALALALVLHRFVPSLYFTVWALIFAYVIRFFSHALQATEAGLARVPVRLEEAARSLGHSTVGVWRRVTLPLVAPSLGAGWTLIFLNALRELPATLLLRPPGFDTLPVRLWIAAGEGFYAQAAAPALLLILLSLPMLFLLRVGDRPEVRHGD